MRRKSLLPIRHEMPRPKTTISSNEPVKSIGSIINDLARQLKVSFDRQAQDLGLTRAQWQLLLHLDRNEGMTQTQLAAALELTVPTVSNLVHRLVARGWIEIRIDPAHRLNKYLYLLPTAQPLLRSVQDLAQKVDLQSLSGLSTKDIAQLFELLACMKRNLIRQKLVAGAAPATNFRRAPAPPKDRNTLVAAQSATDKARRRGS
jgi:MarR family transcriptional regulator for hemolysin